MFRRLAILVVVAAAGLLAGCAGTFGHAQYTITCKPAEGGRTCDLDVKDGKEFAGRGMRFEMNKEGHVAFQVQEGESKAFAGQAIGAKVMTVLPVSGLKDLVPVEQPVIIPVR